MRETIQLRISPEERHNESNIRKEVCRSLGINSDAINDIRIVKESIDARKRDIVYNLNVAVAYGEDKLAVAPPEEITLKRVATDSREIIIVGAGPAGLFAGLRAIEMGLRPIILERGRDVDTRRVDIAQLNRTGVADNESNYCFGEGGAGTFSDGKLYTRSKKRGDNDAVMHLLVQFGADPKILTSSHPHIGSDRLPHIIKQIREKIIECGGEVRFNSRVDALILKTDGGELRATGVTLADGSTIEGEGIILATGHSARDTIRNLHAQGVSMEPKGFAMGVRLEHPSQLIDQLQYHNKEGRGAYLPAAEYNYVTQVEGRGVYSFCMCPGGVVVPAVSGKEESVVNGMSASGRSGKWSNSGMVVEIRPGDFPEFASEGVFELMKVQEEYEKIFYEAAGRTLQAPAQRMYDFVKGKSSNT
ncbi:MAG: NAD(P)/FAD-dependent oxidoreductase, partial [Muribaculaceae bacterium]|nr:NAD(P)/FAD-dependent oxidoreductase [Muribaculaceae bacterium]